MTANDDGPLDGLVRAIEHAEELDLIWFDEHPRRCFRLRYMVIGEFGLHHEDPYLGYGILPIRWSFAFGRDAGKSGRSGLVYFEEVKRPLHRRLSCKAERGLSQRAESRSKTCRR